jgi:N-methylhydantoinase A
LLPFGGAGPLLAAEVAEELGVEEILVPPNPGVISAFGLLAADHARIASITRRRELNEGAAAMFREEFLRFEIPVEIDPARLAALKETDLAAEFSAAHRRIYFHGGEPGRKIEIVGLRFGVRRRLESLPEFHERPAQLKQPEAIEVWTPSGAVRTRLVAASSLAARDLIEGPAMIEGYSSTLWVPPNWRAERDQPGNIVMRRV